MKPQVNAIAGRLSLRPPQRRSLEILDRITELVPPNKAVDLQAAMAAIQSEFPTVTDFEREFPSLCFALATGTSDGIRFISVSTSDFQTRSFYPHSD